MSYLIGEKLTGGYGGPDIIRECNVSVDQGEIVVVVGPNGAGKSICVKDVYCSMVRTFLPCLHSKE